MSVSRVSWCGVLLWWCLIRLIRMLCVVVVSRVACVVCVVLPLVLFVSVLLFVRSSFVVLWAFMVGDVMCGCVCFVVVGV